MPTKTKFEASIPNGQKWAPRKVDVYYMFKGNANFPGTLDVALAEDDYVDQEQLSSLIVRGLPAVAFEKAASALESDNNYLWTPQVIGTWPS